MGEAEKDMFMKEETLTPLELFKKIKRSEDSAEHILKLKKIMMQAMKEELSPRQRECILLHFVHGMQQNEIAKRLKINPSVVSRHIGRGLYRLQRVLKYGCFF